MSKTGDDEIQRALGRIEATLERLVEEFGHHRNEDQMNFSAVRLSLTAEAKSRTESVASLKQDSDRARGAGWVILGILGSLATIVGGCVIAVFAGWVKIKTGSP